LLSWRFLAVMYLSVSAAVWAVDGLPAAAAPEDPPVPGRVATTEATQPTVQQVFRAPDWTGAVNVTDGGCNASMGEYSLWVYARGNRCGVPREQADRVVIIRQPLPGIGPIRALTQLPSGRYFVWVYGAGEAGGSQIRLCARGCVIGDLPTAPAWIPLEPIQLRDRQTLYLRSWQQTDGRRLHVQAVVLSTSNAQPGWIP
jgi:hypothetical protein